MDEDRSSVFDFGVHSASFDFEYGHQLITSKRFILWAVRKVGLKEVTDPDFEKAVELNKPVSISEGYEALFKKHWRRIRNPIATIQKSLNNEVECGYAKVTFSKQGAITYCSFILSKEKWIGNKRFPKEFFETGLSTEKTEQETKEPKEEKKDKPLTQEEVDARMNELKKKLGLKEKQ